MNTMRTHADESSLARRDEQQFTRPIKTGETLDLFGSPALFVQATSATSSAASSTPTRSQPLVVRKVVKKAVRKSDKKTTYVDHLAATRRLHWKLRRAASHSPEEVKAGRLICRHLLAMLAEELDERGHAQSNGQGKASLHG